MTPLERARRRLRVCGIAPEDVREYFTRSPGPGGQNINKVETCVHLIHQATGLSSRAADTRSRAANRTLAWLRLAEAAESRLRQSRQQTLALAAKKRRQLARRSRASKAELVRQKRHRASIRAHRRIRDFES